MILIICPLTFLAGFIDSIAGGGGLISLPSYMLIGLSPHLAAGTNKFSSSLGTLFSTIRYAKNKQIHYKSAMISAGAALVGSFFGAQLALLLSDQYLRLCMVILLPAAAVLLITRKGYGEKNTALELSNSKLIALCVFIGLFLGVYDGFFGPGTGTFLTLAFTGMVGFDLATASGNTKVVNLASNIAALTAFIIGGSVTYAVGIPAAIAGILGNWIGSGLAVRNGARVIKPVLVGVMALLLAKVLWDVFR
ncbi:MAG: TSUP family transporter [Clostridia bacterium]|nr:TSUP family transporter [Clostridia bacterium]